MTDTVWFVLSALCFAVGLFIIGTAVLGVFRFRFALNRIHSAAMLDTMGIFFILLGLMLAVRSAAFLPKLILLLLLLWIGSPLTSHLVSRLELSTDETARENMEEEDRT